MAARPKRVTLPSVPAVAAPDRPADIDGADFNVKVRIRNGRLLRAISQAGYLSVADFARNNGFHYSAVAEFVQLKRSPYQTSGKPSGIALDIADVLRSNIDDLFPPQFLGKCLAKTAYAEVPSLTEGQVAMLLHNIPKTPEELAMLADVPPLIDIALKSLPSRKENIIRLRNALSDDAREETLEEVGKRYQLSRERIKQIEFSGYRQLKANSRKNGLKIAAECLGVFSSYHPVRNRHVPPLAVRMENERQRAQLIADEQRGVQELHDLAKKLRLEARTQDQKLRDERQAAWAAGEAERVRRAKAAREAQEARRKRERIMQQIIAACPEPPPEPERPLNDDLVATRMGRRIAFPGEGKQKRRTTPFDVIRDRTHAPPPETGIVIGTPGEDEWVDLRGILFVEDERAAAVIFHEQLVFTFPNGRQAMLPAGSYIVPHRTIKNLQSKVVEVCHISGQQQAGMRR